MSDRIDLSETRRADAARLARMNLGLASPMWLPFLAAASVGAAWWTLQNWPRLIAAASSTGGPGGPGGAPSESSRAGAEPARPPASVQPPHGSHVRVQPVEPPKAAPRSPAETADALTADADGLREELASRPAATALGASLAVQDDDAAPDVPSPDADDGADLVDAAYAAALGAVPQPALAAEASTQHDRPAKVSGKGPGKVKVS